MSDSLHDPPARATMTAMPALLRHVPRIESRAAIASLVAGVSLMSLKFAAYFLTNSSAVFSDALESTVNVAAAGFAIYSLSLAHRPADIDHPYGHGKIEFVAAGFEGSMILLAALVSVVRAVDSLLHNFQINTGAIGVGLGLMALALFVNGALGAVLLRVGRTAQSATLRADGHHLLSDAITSVAAIAGLLIVRFTGWRLADPIAALIVAAYIGRTGVILMRGAVAGLMDRQDVEDERLLQSILDAHIGPAGKPPRICSYHKLRHRHSGRYHWVDFHLVVPADWNVDRGHRVASAIEHEIELALGIGNATAHIEPCAQPRCASCEFASSEVNSAPG